MPAPEFHTYAAKVTRAARRADADATEAQREAGNARVGKVYFHGIECSIEWPKGSTRTGTGKDGKKWSRPMYAHYGRINRTTGKDDEHVDFYCGPHPESQIVFVISQLDEDGNLDEHKCVMGCRNVQEAKKLYLSHFPSWWKDERLGEIRGYTMSQFKDWLKSDCPVKNRTKTAEDRGPEGEYCPHCDARLERDPSSGTCNSCGKAWPAKAASFFCKGCNTFIKDRDEDDGCPNCENKEAAVRLAALSQFVFGG